MAAGDSRPGLWLPEEEKSKMFDKVSVIPVQTEEVVERLGIGRNTYFRHRRNENEVMSLEFAVGLVRYLEDEVSGLEFQEVEGEGYVDIPLEERRKVIGAVDRNVFEELTGYSSGTLRYYRNDEDRRVDGDAYRTILDYITGVLYQDIEFERGAIVNGETYRSTGGDVEKSTVVESPSWDQVEAYFEEGAATRGAVLKNKFGETFS